MRVQVLFFGMLKDITGHSQEQLELEAGSRLQTVFDHYASRFPRLQQMAASIVMARNQQFAPLDTFLEEGDEVAFLPPVSGGSEPACELASPYIRTIEDPEGHFFALTRQPVEVAEIRRRLLQPHDGAVVTFEGVVRNQSQGRKTRYLDYECYEGMAIEVMARLGREIAAQHAISRIALVHRLGRMEIGETSVAVIVTAPHRKPAFEAALEGINRLKRTVPIWKKEYFEDGAIWVEGEWDQSITAS
ncbi:MAG: molybdenum cofactor biosynthesis protein MoaE [Bryobacteraceae bacterium]|nr:molybdenum cofactor biosynthesis protein MoaE [Bryobacteraceae bacterium]MDW8377172.1 molybdenum cofactor biosynthesis protein MoaE [Bryobacterales bacterium]